MIPDKETLHQQLYEERFKAFCDKWYALLQLCQWEISYAVASTIDGGPNIQAQCRVQNHLGHRAEITFSEQMGYDDEATREELIIHELLHIPLDEMAEFVHPHLSETEWEYFRRLMEIAVSDLARVLMVLGENIPPPSER